MENIPRVVSKINVFKDKNIILRNEYLIKHEE